MKLFFRKNLAVLCCLLFSNLYSNNANEILINLATVNALSGENQSGINLTAPLLSFISSAANNSNIDGVIAAATTAAANSNPNSTGPVVRLDALIFNGNDVTIIATTDSNSRIDITLHTPISGTVTIMLDDNPYANPLTGLRIIQDQSANVFTAAGDISLDYVLDVAGGAQVTCSNALNVLSGTGGAFIYIEDGSFLAAASILFDGNNNQSAIRNLGFIEATTGDIVMQNCLGGNSFAGIDNRGTIVADVGNIVMVDNQGGDTSAAIYNNACIRAFQNISMNRNSVRTNNQAIMNSGRIIAGLDVEINHNQCGLNSFALYNDGGAEIYSDNHYINILNNNDIVNYGTIAAPLQLTFQDNSAINATGVILEGFGTVQSDTIQFINNSGSESGKGVVINGTVYSFDNIIITTDCTSSNQAVAIQVPFYLCNSNKSVLFPSSKVIINNTGDCSVFSTLSILGDITADGNTNIIAITVPDSGSITDYISVIGDVTITVPVSGDVTINGVLYADTIPGLTVTKSDSIIPFLIGGYLTIYGTTTIKNGAELGTALGMTAIATAAGTFVEVDNACSLISFGPITIDGAAIGSIINNGGLVITNAFSLPGGDFVIKSCANSSGAAVTLNGNLEIPSANIITIEANASTVAQGVLLGGLGTIKAGRIIFLNNSGSTDSYGFEVDGALQTNLLEIIVNCTSDNQAFVINTVPMIYDNSVPLTNIILDNNGCVNAGGTLQALDGAITFDGSNLLITGTVSVVGDYGVILNTPSDGTILVNGEPYVSGSISNLLVRQTNSSNTFAVGGSLSFQNLTMQNNAQVTTAGSVTVTSGTFNLASGALTVENGLTYDGGDVVGNQFANFGPIVAISGDISITRAKVNSSAFPASIAVYVGSPITANIGNISISGNSNLDTDTNNTIVFIFDHVKAIIGNITVNGNNAAGGLAVQLGVLSQCQLEAGGSVVMDSNVGGLSGDNGKAILTQAASKITGSSVEISNNTGGIGVNAQAIYHAGTILASGGITISNNTVGDSGSGVWLYPGSTVHSTGGNIIISNNSCSSNGNGFLDSGTMLTDVGSISINGNNSGTVSGNGVYISGATTTGTAGITMNNNIGISNGAAVSGSSMKTNGSFVITVSGESTQHFNSSPLPIQNISSSDLPFTNFFITIDSTHHYGGSSGNSYSDMQTAYPGIVILAGANRR